MTLYEYWRIKPKAIYPQTELIDSILEEEEKEFGEQPHRRTVMNWLNGETMPDRKHWKILSKCTGIKEEDLFENGN